MEINKSIKNAFSCSLNNLGKLVFLERENKLKNTQPKTLESQTLLSSQLDRKDMKSDTKEKLLRREKNNTLHPEMIVLKSGNA